MSLAYLDMENGFCRCCLNEGNLKSLGDTFFVNEDEVEVYSLMLKECFDVTILQVKGMYSETTYSICENCIHMLREASFFKKMIIQSEIKFHDFYSKKFSKEMKSIKVELDEVIIPEDHDKDDPMEMEDDKMNVHIDDDVFHYPESDEDKKTTVELKIEHEPATTKKPQIVVKKDADLYMSKLRKRKEPVAKPQKKPQPQKTSAPETQPKPSSQSKMKPRKGLEPPDFYTKTVDKETGVANFQCVNCDKSFKAYRGIHQHYHYVHLKERKLARKCLLCPLIIDNSKRVVHMEEVHGIERPKCNTCGKKFNYINKLNVHQRNAHMGEKNYKCSVCDREFFFKHRLDRHMILHTGVKDFKCDSCGKAFRWIHNLQAHLKTHTGSKPYVCDICNAAYAEKRSLRHHMEKNHCTGLDPPDFYTKIVDKGTGVASFQCVNCDKSFKIYKGVYQHYHYVHLKERKLTRKCLLCALVIDDSKRVLHMEEVHGIKRPKCNACGKIFNHKYKLNIHQRNAHMGEKNYKCSLCDREFFFKYKLERHMIMHTNVKDFKCDSCGKSFGRRHNLKAHLKTHTGAKPHVCGICNAAYTEKRSLNHHIEKNHSTGAQLKVHFKS